MCFRYRSLNKKPWQRKKNFGYQLRIWLRGIGANNSLLFFVWTEMIRRSIDEETKEEEELWVWNLRSSMPPPVQVLLETLKKTHPSPYLVVYFRSGVSTWHSTGLCVCVSYAQPSVTVGWEEGIYVFWRVWRLSCFLDLFWTFSSTCASAHPP